MNNKPVWLLLLVTFLLAVNACSSLPDIVPQIPLPRADYHALPDGKDIEVANQLLQAGKKREAASAYFAAAENYSSPERERLILQAAELAAVLKEPNLTERYLAPINYNVLNQENQARYRLIQGQLALNDRNYREALRLLPQRVTGLPNGLANKVLNTRKTAAKASGDRLLLIQELILQEPNLKNDYEVSLNHDRIWNHLQQMSLQRIEKGLQSTRHPIVTGWLELGTIAKTRGMTKEELSRKLNRWQQKHPNHPGNRKVSSLLNSYSTATVTPYLGGIKPAKNNPITPSQSQNITIFLPLTGKLSSIGKTLLKGIQETQKQSGITTPFKIINTENGDMSSAYNTAVKNGALKVIGPFSKAKLALLAQKELSVPTIGLNYITTRTSNLYQFGLSPEDEAVQMAQTVQNKGQRRVAILTPDSAWGRRLQNAIKKATEARQGKIMFIASYDNGLSDLNLLTSKLASQTNQLDAILIAASPTQARRLYPALRNITNMLPIYATSHVYNGRPDPANDQVLSGLIYTEIPWVLDKVSLQKNSTTPFPRIFAMGMDALKVANKLADLKAGASLQGATGVIRLSSDGTLHRTLRWAEFKNGIPVPY